MDSGLETNSQLPTPCSFSNTTTYFWKLHGTQSINKHIPFPPLMQVGGWHSRTELRPVSSDTCSRPTWVSRLKPCLKEPALLCLLSRIHKILGVILALSSNYWLNCNQPVISIMYNISKSIVLVGLVDWTKWLLWQLSLTKGQIFSEKYWYYFHCPKNMLS